jgi:hypothetical protein
MSLSSYVIGYGSNVIKSTPRRVCHCMYSYVIEYVIGHVCHNRYAAHCNVIKYMSLYELRMSYFLIGTYDIHTCMLLKGDGMSLTCLHYYHICLRSASNNVLCHHEYVIGCVMSMSLP